MQVLLLLRVCHCHQVVPRGPRVVEKIIVFSEKNSFKQSCSGFVFKNDKLFVVCDFPLFKIKITFVKFELEYLMCELIESSRPRAIAVRARASDSPRDPRVVGILIGQRGLSCVGGVYILLVCGGGVEFRTGVGRVKFFQKRKRAQKWQIINLKGKKGFFSRFYIEKTKFRAILGFKENFSLVFRIQLQTRVHC